MFMYMFHIAFGIGLIALVMGLAMFKCCCHKGACDTTNGGHSGHHCCKWAGVIISILAIISLVCTAMTGYKQMNSGMMDMDMGHMKEKMKEMKKDMKKNAGMDDSAE